MKSSPERSKRWLIVTVCYFGCVIVTVCIFCFQPDETFHWDTHGIRQVGKKPLMQHDNTTNVTQHVRNMQLKRSTSVHKSSQKHHSQYHSCALMTTPNDLRFSIFTKYISRFHHWDSTVYHCFTNRLQLQTSASTHIIWTLPPHSVITT